MRTGISQAIVLLSGLLCLFDSQEISAKNLYRIEDESGRTIYSDQVPAESNKFRRELLNQQGRSVQTTEKAKTKEQIELENRLAALRKEEEKLIARQKVHDEALLSTFHSKGEIAETLTVKMQEFDSQRKVVETSLKNATQQLDNQLKVAASFERNGQPVPKLTLDNIQYARQQINQIKTAIHANMDKQELVRREFQADIERYLFLTQTLRTPVDDAIIPSIKEANALGLFYCDNDHQCNKAWEIARAFINQHSTTPPNVFNEKLIMNRPPSKDTDISLSLSRIAITDNDYLLFLDIYCQDSAPGRELCASQKVKDIRSAFRSYVNDSLSHSGK